MIKDCILLVEIEHVRVVENDAGEWQRVCARMRDDRERLRAFIWCRNRDMKGHCTLYACVFDTG